MFAFPECFFLTRRNEQLLLGMNIAVMKKCSTLIPWDFVADEQQLRHHSEVLTLGNRQEGRLESGLPG